MKCPNCKKDLEQTQGKREKQFCNSTCRSNYWQKLKRIASKMPRDFGEVINLSTKDRYIEIKNPHESQNKPVVAIKKEETPKPTTSTMDDLERQFQEQLRKIKNK